MLITILTDNSKSWFVPFGNELKTELEKSGNDVIYIFDKNEIREGDICFILSCTRIIDEEFLKRNKNNIVVHASDLPDGKGFSPLQWQILEGKNEIVLTLFEVAAKVDAGPYYQKDKLVLKGTELYDELRSMLGLKIIEMCIYYVNNRADLKPIEQSGEETFYKRRTVKDDEIDPQKSIAGQFNHFRIADNDKFPLYFKHLGEEYILKIFKKTPENK